MDNPITLSQVMIALTAFGGALAVVGGAMAYFFGVKGDVGILKSDVRGIKDALGILNTSFEKLSDILSKVAVQDQRINRIEEDIRELRHGEGLVFPLSKSRREVP